ncbi:MAG: ATP-grasp domain-containing protein [Phycisphaerae bacterium]
MANHIPILVTGAGSELAFGIIKALRLSKLPLRIIGCDADPEALGLHWSDHAEVVSRADTHPKQYQQEVIDLVRRHNIRAVIPTPDVELDLLPSVRDLLKKEHGCHLFISAQEEMDRFHDKWAAFQWYQEFDLPTPDTVRGDDAEGIDRLIETFGFPLIVKPRRGGGSRSLFPVDSRDSLERCLPVVDAPIVQPVVGDGSHEYTAGTLRTRDDEVLTIVMQRQLKFGMTYRARTVMTERLHRACAEIIRKTNLEGVNNIQFRTVGEGIKILEINPRFSGTTGIRAHFGFNEPDLAIRHFVLNEPVSQPTIAEGAVSRYMHESYTPSISGAWSSFASVDMTRDGGRHARQC